MLTFLDALVISVSKQMVSCLGLGFVILLYSTDTKVGVPNLETDLFTNVNKPCPSCDAWSAKAGKLLGNVHVPKPVPNLCMSCVQAWALLVHWSSCLDTSCTLELLLGHSLYTTQVLLGHSLCTRATAWALHRYCLGTPCALYGYCLGTPCVHSV